MKRKILILCGIILAVIILSFAARFFIYESEFKFIKTENNKMFFVLMEQRGISNNDYQISIYSAFKKTRFGCEGYINKFDIKFNSIIDDVEFYEISLSNDIGENVTYLQLYSKEINKLIDKSILIKSFDDYDYSKLKKYILKKIISGEHEWLYSYGEPLLSEGHYEILEAIRSINTIEQCKNDFIEAGLLYGKCQELLQKYGGEQ